MALVFPNFHLTAGSRAICQSVHVFVHPCWNPGVRNRMTERDVPQGSILGPALFDRQIRFKHIFDILEYIKAL